MAATHSQIQGEAAKDRAEIVEEERKMASERRKGECEVRTEDGIETEIKSSSNSS